MSGKPAVRPEGQVERPKPASLWAHSIQGSCPLCGLEADRCWLYVQWERKLILLVYQHARDQTLCATCAP